VIPALGQYEDDDRPLRRGNGIGRCCSPRGCPEDPVRRGLCLECFSYATRLHLLDTWALPEPKQAKAPDVGGDVSHVNEPTAAPPVPTPEPPDAGASVMVANPLVQFPVSVVTSAALTTPAAPAVPTVRTPVVPRTLPPPLPPARKAPEPAEATVDSENGIMRAPPEGPARAEIPEVKAPEPEASNRRGPPQNQRQVVATPPGDGKTRCMSPRLCDRPPAERGMCRACANHHRAKGDIDVVGLPVTPLAERARAAALIRGEQQRAEREAREAAERQRKAAEAKREQVRASLEVPMIPEAELRARLGPLADPEPETAPVVAPPVAPVPARPPDPTHVRPAEDDSGWREEKGDGVRRCCWPTLLSIGGYCRNAPNRRGLCSSHCSMASLKGILEEVAVIPPKAGAARRDQDLIRQVAAPHSRAADYSAGCDAFLRDEPGEVPPGFRGNPNVWREGWADEARRQGVSTKRAPSLDEIMRDLARRKAAADELIALPNPDGMYRIHLGLPLGGLTLHEDNEETAALFRCVAAAVAEGIARRRAELEAIVRGES
jgi:hypothetical protein